MVEQVFHSQELHSEGQVHDFNRVTVAASQVNQTAFAQQVQLTSVSHGVGHDIFAYFIRSNYRKLLQMMFVDFYVEVACVAHNSSS